MKKYFLGVITGFAVCTMLVSTMAIAGSPIRLIVNGNDVESDVPPQVINGRTMFPIRPLVEALGATVEWDGVNNTATVTGGVEVGVVSTDLEPVNLKPIDEVRTTAIKEDNEAIREDKKEDEGVGNAVVEEKNEIKTYKKDGYIFTIENGVEYIPAAWIEYKIDFRKYSILFDLDKEELGILYRKRANIPNDEDKVILKGVPYKVMNYFTCITKDDYENKVLPAVNKG